MVQLVDMGLSVCHLMRNCYCHMLFSCGFAHFSRSCQLSQNIAVKSIGWLPHILYFYFRSSAPSGSFMTLTVSSAIHSCLQLPSSSPHRSCWWRRLVSVTVFFLLFLMPNILFSVVSCNKDSYLKTCQIHVMWVVAVVFCTLITSYLLSVWAAGTQLLVMQFVVKF